MRYTVIKIEEDLDFGCEERREDQPVMAVVTLRSETDEEIKRKVPDQLLYDEKIDEGSTVVFDDFQNLRGV